jgi:uncharacterized membrane protein
LAQVLDVLVAANQTQSKPDSPDRLIFFSDAVVAIAMTLLALELPVPAGPDTHAFLASVRANDGEYLSFLISFVVIARTWNQHYRLFRYVTGEDQWLRTANLLWLLLIVITPFATKLLTVPSNDTQATHALRWGFYALLVMLQSSSFLAMVHHLSSKGLLAADAPPRLRSDSDWGSMAVVVGFGLSIPLFFLTPEAWVLWAVTSPISDLVRRQRRRRDHG